MSVNETVRELVEPPLADAGFALYDVDFSGGRLLVLVERPDAGGIDLDGLTEATHLVNRIVDEADPVPGGSYVLEVSSPGVERPLRTPAHFQAALGKKINVKTTPEVDGERRIEAVLDSADDDGIAIAGRRIPYAGIERARVVFEWGPAPKPSQKKKAHTR